MEFANMEKEELVTVAETLTEANNAMEKELLSLRDMIAQEKYDRDMVELRLHRLLSDYQTVEVAQWRKLIETEVANGQRGGDTALLGIGETGRSGA